MAMSDYTIEKTVSWGVEETIERVTAALAVEGFGVLSQIRVHEKFKEKLGVDFKTYVILGACHPPSAYEALTADDSIGVLMPCNVVVHEHEGGSKVKAVRPSKSLAVAGRMELAHLADTVESGLRRVVESL